MSRHRTYHDTKERPGSFGPLFDWFEPEEARPVGGPDPLEALRAACLGHVEAGGLIARQLFGVSVVDRRRKDDRSPLTGTYKAENYCDPFGALLVGRRRETFEESASYREGYEAGMAIGGEFARIQVGWEGQ
ncbi:MAG TPA: hypothetical protein VF297_05070 [Pyrinomonadaceae bacterium]